MSINRNRAKLKKAHNNKEYNALRNRDPYPYEGIRYYPIRNRGTRKYWIKGLCKYKIREYRTWKYQRLNQYK